ALLTCRPRKAAESFTPAKEANASLRAILAEVAPQYPGIALGLTGLPVLESDEMELSDADSRRASLYALAGVAVLYFAVYGGTRYPLLTITTLVVGTLWALGWATLTVGHLNILSATFAVMLIGLGDYGVLWVARFDEARRRGESVEGALRDTALHAGPSILTAAATTGLAFFAVMLADFKAVAELGWIAGCGVLLCAASCILVMPALLVLANPDRKVGGVAAGGFGSVHPGTGVPGSPTIPFPAAFLPGVARRPRLALGAGTVLVAVCAVFAFRLTYDHNLLNLQPRGLDSVAWEHKLIDRAAGATWDSLSVAHSREEALAIKARYETLPEVGKVVEVASLVPADQDAKMPAVRAIHDRLAGLPAADRVPAPPGSNPAAVRDLADKVARLAGDDDPLSHAAHELAVAVEECPYPVARLLQFDRRMSADLAAELHQLKAVSRPAPITEADVPVELRERYRGANGEYLVRAFARDSLWDYAALARFTAAANTVDPDATGKPFRTLEGLRQMKRGFEWAAVYALAAIVAVLMLDLRRVKDLLLGLFPLAVGVVMTLGVMGLCGVALNPANMIALPLIVGVGVDNGVHVLHDYRGRMKGVAYRLGAATGRGVMVAGLTTVLGFGTLMTARHAGMASLGLALTLGVTFSMLAALVWLPALLRLRDARRQTRTRGPKPAVVQLEMAKAA
ncbi:MAG TPA: MMPL family transporter, partial [Gemmata sp.]|nr:MMPL family transporter [Gemmata sp.]